MLIASLHALVDTNVSLFYLCVLVVSAEPVNFLGISIVGQSNDDGDGGIFVGSVMKG